MEHKNGTNFDYPSFIGWGSADLPELVNVFAGIDSRFTTVLNLVAALQARMAEPVADVTALKAINTTDATAWPDRIVVFVEGAARYFSLDRNSTATEELGPPVEVVAPTTGVGRWLVVEATIGTADLEDACVTLTKGAADLIDSANHTFDPGTSGLASTNPEAAILEVLDLLVERGLVAPVDAALAGGSIPAAPADGYRVFCTATAGGFDAGKIYTYDGTGATYDAGVSLAEKQAVLVGGASPDLIVVGSGGAVEAFSLKANQVVPAQVGNFAALNAGGDLVDSFQSYNTVAPVVEGNNRSLASIPANSLVAVQGHETDGAAAGQLSVPLLVGGTALNTDDGWLYGSLSDAAGTRMVNLYSDSGRSVLVASGSKVGDGEITLAEVGSSGLSGKITVTYTADGDFTILTQLSGTPNFRIFDGTSDAAEDLIGSAVSTAIDGAAVLVMVGRRARVLVEDTVNVEAGDSLYFSATVPGRVTSVDPGGATVIATALTSVVGGTDETVWLMFK